MDIKVTEGGRTVEVNGVPADISGVCERSNLLSVIETTIREALNPTPPKTESINGEEGG